MTRFVRREGAALAVATAVALSVVAATASGGVSGPCSATLAGTNVATRGTGATAKPIVVGHDALVPIVLSAQGQLTRVRISVEFAGISWVVKDRAVNTPVYRDTIPVKNYARYGVGLYRVSGTGTGAGFSCTGSTLVKVKGNPLTSAVGIGGIAATLIGGTGLVLTGLGFGSSKGVSPFRFVRGLVAGLVAALGILVLLQEAALIYPTATVAIAGLAVGAVVGAGAAFAPALGRPATHGHGFTGTPGRPLTPAI